MNFKRSWLNGLYIERKFRLRHILRLLALSLFNVCISAIALSMFYQELMNVLLSVDSPFALMPDEMADISNQIPGLHETLVLWIGSLAGIIGLVTLIGGYMITQKVVGPVHNLKKKLNLVLKGDLTVGIKLRKGDEYQDIADAVNQMVMNKRDVITCFDAELKHIETLDNLPLHVRDKLKIMRKRINHYQI